MECPSPFSSYLQTNYAATDGEKIKLTDFLIEPISKLAMLKEELDSIQAHYQDVLKEYNALSQSIEDHRALMAPIRRIPTDIIQEIFLRCLPQTHNAIMSHRECPLLLTQICSSWRHAALNTAPLWKSIHVPIPEQGASRDVDPVQHEVAMSVAKQRAELIAWWLSHSGSSTLDISLYEACESASKDIYDIVLDVLTPFSNRWGTLVCQTPSINITPITMLPPSSLPRLHTMVINAPRKNSWTEQLLIQGLDDWMRSTLFLAPNLRRITYSQEYTKANIYDLPLRWRQLTKLDIIGSSSMSIRRLANILLECSLLEFLGVRFSVTNELNFHYNSRRLPEISGVSPTPTEIFLPKLTSLVIDYFGWMQDTAELFDALYTPALLNLDVSCPMSVYPSLLTLITNTTQTLHILKIHCCVFTSQNMLFTLLSSLDGLTELDLQPLPRGTSYGSETTVSDVFNDEAIFQLLTGSSSNPYATRIWDAPILPSLSVFRFLGFSLSLTGSEVLKAVRMRNTIAASGTGTFAKLHTLAITFSRAQSMPLLEEVEKLSEDGVACTFTFLYAPPPALDHSPFQGIPGRESKSKVLRWGEPIPVSF